MGGATPDPTPSPGSLSPSLSPGLQGALGLPVTLVPWVHAALQDFPNK